LEQEADVAPFAITCGIYGWMVHARFFEAESEAQREFEMMKDGLAQVLDTIPLTGDPEIDAKARAVSGYWMNLFRSIPSLRFGAPHELTPLFTVSCKLEGRGDI
jgi:hypothetical protein